MTPSDTQVFHVTNLARCHCQICRKPLVIRPPYLTRTQRLNRWVRDVIFRRPVPVVPPAVAVCCKLAYIFHVYHVQATIRRLPE